MTGALEAAPVSTPNKGGPMGDSRFIEASGSDAGEAIFFHVASGTGGNFIGGKATHLLCNVALGFTPQVMQCEIADTNEAEIGQLFRSHTLPGVAMGGGNIVSDRVQDVQTLIGPSWRQGVAPPARSADVRLALQARMRFSPHTHTSRAEDLVVATLARQKLDNTKNILLTTLGIAAHDRVAGARPAQDIRVESTPLFIGQELCAQGLQRPTLRLEGLVGRVASQVEGGLRCDIRPQSSPSAFGPGSRYPS